MDDFEEKTIDIGKYQLVLRKVVQERKDKKDANFFIISDLIEK